MARHPEGEEPPRPPHPSRREDSLELDLRYAECCSAVPRCHRHSLQHPRARASGVRTDVQRLGSRHRAMPCTQGLIQFSLLQSHANYVSLALCPRQRLALCPYPLPTRSPSCAHPNATLLHHHPWLGCPPFLTAPSPVQTFKDATLFFSRDTPSLAMVIPAMDHIDNILTGQTRASSPLQPPVSAALRLAKKTLNRYYKLSDMSATYRIAMGT